MKLEIMKVNKVLNQWHRLQNVCKIHLYISYDHAQDFMEIIVSGSLLVPCWQNHGTRILIPRIIVDFWTKFSFYIRFLYTNKTNLLDQSAWLFDNPKESVSHDLFSWNLNIDSDWFLWSQGMKPKKCFLIKFEILWSDVNDELAVISCDS